MNRGSRSISTFSDGTKRLLRCLRGGLPIIGIVSLGVCWRRRLRGVCLGGSPGLRLIRSCPPTYPPLACACVLPPCESGLTTTIGGAGDERSPCAILPVRSGAWGTSRLERLPYKPLEDPIWPAWFWDVKLRLRGDVCWGWGSWGFALFGGGGGGLLLLACWCDGAAFFFSSFFFLSPPPNYIEVS